jgi:nitroreductase
MPIPNPAALDFLLTRRSRPAKTLRAPVPDRDTIQTLLTAAARTPDHGKLEPWRFIVLEKPALARLAGMVPARAKSHQSNRPILRARSACRFLTRPLHPDGARTGFRAGRPMILHFAAQVLALARMNALRG